MPTLTEECVRGRTLISGELFDRMTARIAADHPELAADMPARIMDQALALLAACSTSAEPLGPSDLVDFGWHTFILYTREYAAFCDRIAGRFIHHVPDDSVELRWPITLSGDTPISRTVAAIRAKGYVVDVDLWRPAGAECSQCHQGCHDSPSR